VWGSNEYGGKPEMGIYIFNGSQKSDHFRGRVNEMEGDWATIVGEIQLPQ